MDATPAARCLLAAWVGVRGLRCYPMPGLRRRRLDRWLHERNPPPPRATERASQGSHRALGTCLSALCASGSPDRLPARDAAMVGLLAQGHRHRRDGRAYAARLDDRERRARALSRGAAGPLDRRKSLATGGSGTLSPVPDRGWAARRRNAPSPPSAMLSSNRWPARRRVVSLRPFA